MTHGFPEFLRILAQIRELQSKTAETKENQRKQSTDNSRVAKMLGSP